MKTFRFLVFQTLILFSVASCSYRPLFAPDEIPADISITEDRNSILIEPLNGAAADVGLLFYPGGLVDNHVYNKLLSGFSSATGVPVVVVKMPANLAVLDIYSGLEIVEDFPDTARWVIAGHSLGGSMAASVVFKYPDEFEGLIFMDSYPANSAGLSGWSGAVLSLFSSIEKISDSERMEQTLSLIPPATWIGESSRVYPADKSNYSVLHQIDGGSHSYFGTYGPQDGDYTPTITREEFHSEVIDYMREFFDENGWR
ncbi:MAG: hypothetical protein JXR86_08135 [Spirochaetales bacterium]|nr:hypothetical protein [Spirochaetales bacterium]